MRRSALIVALLAAGAAIVSIRHPLAGVVDLAIGRAGYYRP